MKNPVIVLLIVVVALVLGLGFYTYWVNRKPTATIKGEAVPSIENQTETDTFPRNFLIGRLV